MTTESMKVLWVVVLIRFTFFVFVDKNQFTEFLLCDIFYRNYTGSRRFYKTEMCLRPPVGQLLFSLSNTSQPVAHLSNIIREQPNIFNGEAQQGS